MKRLSGERRADGQETTSRKVEKSAGKMAKGQQRWRKFNIK